MASNLAPSGRARGGDACTRALAAVAIVVACVQLGTLAWALYWRARFSMDLEWLESAQLYEAWRFAHALPVFGPPEQGFVPSPYPPLFHLVVAGIGRVFGYDYWNGRVVSDVAIVAALVVQGVVVKRAAPERRLGWTLAILGAAAAAATYRPLQASMDLARVDMLGIAIALVAALLVARGRVSTPRAVVVGGLLCAAVFTKQTNVFYAAWIVLALARRDRRAGIVVAATALASATATLARLQHDSSGWFWIWMTEMKHHPLVPERCAVLGTVTIALAAIVAVSMRALAKRRWLSDGAVFWTGMLAASVPAGVVPMLTPGGWLNNLIGPALLAWIVALHLVCDALRGVRLRPALQTHATRWVIALLGAYLLGALYDPSANVPDAERTRDVEALHAMVRELDGDVLVPMYPFVAARDGKATPQLSLVADFDAMGSGRMPIDLPAAVRDAHPRWVILCGHDQEHDLPAWLGRAYVAHTVDLRVQALREETRRGMTVLERAPD